METHRTSGVNVKVSELKVGELYKIRSDRITYVRIFRGKLDIHISRPNFYKTKPKVAKIRPFDHLTYLGQRNGNRYVIYRGEKLMIYPNAWQHIVPLDDDIS